MSKLIPRTGTAEPRMSASTGAWHKRLYNYLPPRDAGLSETLFDAFRKFEIS